MTAPSRAGDWIVLKFGGTSVSQRHRWDTVGRLMRERAEEAGARVLVVVSALSGITNALQAMVDADDALDARVEAIAERHRAFAGTLGLDASVLDERLEVLSALATDPRRADAPLAWAAEVLGQGELLSSTLGVAYLRTQGMDVGWLDARDWLHALALPNQNAWSQRLSVSCRHAHDPAMAAALADGPRMRITQGFIARHDDGGTAILGRGGSDTSAAYFGALLRARRVEIWTDVPGMFTANPRLVPDARLLTRLDYEEAQEIASTGAKVLHPRCLYPCREARVPIWIRDTERPAMAGTVIDHRAVTLPGVKAISSRRGIVLVSMETIGMWQQVGFLADVFERFKRRGLSIDLIGSSEANVTVSLDPSDNLVNSNVLDALCADLAEICRVKVITPCSAVTLVGRGMRSLLHKLTDVWSEFGRERVHLISQSSNDLNLTFVVDEALAEDCCRSCMRCSCTPGRCRWTRRKCSGRAGASSTPPAPSACTRKRGGARRRSARGCSPSPRKARRAYAYHLPTVRERARALAQLGAVDRRFYALKANAHPADLQALEQEGFGFECVSRPSSSTCSQVLPGSTRPRAVHAELRAARGVRVRAGCDAWVTVDSVVPLRQWPELFRGRELVLRIDPGYGLGHHESPHRRQGSEVRHAADALPGFLGGGARGGAASPCCMRTSAAASPTSRTGRRCTRTGGARRADRHGVGIDVGGGLGIAYDRARRASTSPPSVARWRGEGGLAAVRAVDRAGSLPRGRIRRAARARHPGGREARPAPRRPRRRHERADAPGAVRAWHEIANLSRLDSPRHAGRGGRADLRVERRARQASRACRKRRRKATSRAGDGRRLRLRMANTYNQRALPREVVIDD
jgi:diaminopimelate decarboxylase/aspartate kinase